MVRSVVRRPLAVLLLLASAATLIYSNTFSSSFHFDDKPNIIDDIPTKNLSSLLDLSESRSVGVLTFALNYRLDRLNVWGYHLVNLLIHITNGFLVYILVSLLCKTPGTPFRLPDRFPHSARSDPDQARGIAFITALLFVTHPIQTQAVTYIVQRFTSLATLFYLLAVIGYLKWRLAEPGNGRRHWWYALALGSTILAMKTKEISFTLPFMLLLIEGICFRRSTWKQWLPLIPFLLTLPIIPLSLSGGLAQAKLGLTRETLKIDRLSYLFTQFPVIVTYLRLLILPIHQNVDYDYPVYHSLLEAPVFVSLLVLLGLLGLAVYLLCYHRQLRLVAFGLLWFFLTLSIESSIIPIRDVIFEHRVYLPSVGFLLSGSALVVSLLPRLGALVVVVVAGVAVLCSVASYQRNLVWKDEVTLWSDVVAASPKKARGHYNLGSTYIDLGRFEEAITELGTAIRLNPDYAEAYNNLGIAYERQGWTENAITELETALRLSPDYPEAHNNLGNAYLQQGRLEPATTHYLTAVRLNPAYAEAHNNLGNAYVRQGRLENAITELETALRLNPDYPEAHNNLGNAYLQQGRLEPATAHYLTAVRLNPAYAEAHKNLGNAYLRQGRPEEAITELETALRLNPDYPEAHNNLGNAYLRQGRLEAATAEYVTAIRLNPVYPEAHHNLGNAYLQQGRLEEAITELVTAIHLNPNYLNAHYQLGNAYARRGQLDEAIKEYVTVVHLGANSSEVYFNLGNTYKLRGLRNEARKQFEAALQLKPDFVPAQRALRSLGVRP